MIYNLPHDLTPADAPDTGPVIIRRYQSRHNTLKNKIILHKNMINLLISGEKTILHAEGTTTIREGEFLILSCGNCLTTEVLPLNDIFSSIILYFDNELLTDFLHKHIHLIKEEKHKKKPFLTGKQDAFISNYVHSLDLLLQLPSPLLPEFKKLKLEELLLYLLEKDPSTLYSLLIVTQNKEDLSIKTAVESNIGNPVTVEELAFLCHCSPSTFKRKFKSIYGLPPQKWLLEQKMQLAADLLRHPHERPGQVYQQVGYENHSSFTQSFKKQYGMTPKEYQEQNLTR
ncbi:MAG TPA: AraC family transcriptional regulator [Puia sp.]|nr:AraC family transcriptional regulator [Puia sp.]